MKIHERHQGEPAYNFALAIVLPHLLFDFVALLCGPKAAVLGHYELAMRFASGFFPTCVPIGDDFALFLNLDDGSAAGE